MATELMTTDLTTEGPAAHDAVTTETTAEFVEEELLVEEISIDGMCGVY